MAFLKKNQPNSF